MGFFHELILEALHHRKIERTSPPAMDDDEEFDYSQFEPNAQDESDEIPPPPAKPKKVKRRSRKSLSDLERRFNVFFDRGVERLKELQDGNSTHGHSRQKKDPFAKKKKVIEWPALKGTWKRIKTPLFTTDAEVPAARFRMAESCCASEASEDDDYFQRCLLKHEIGYFLSKAIDVLDNSLNQPWKPEYGPQAETVGDALEVIRLCYVLSNCIENKDWLAAISCAIAVTKTGVRLDLRKHEYEFMAGKRRLSHNREAAASKKRHTEELRAKYEKKISALMAEQERNGLPPNYRSAVNGAISSMPELDQRDEKTVAKLVPNRWTTGQRGRRPKNRKNP